ncbi:MAG TPA: hypothetical protein VKU01_04475 [Bryobacteraceae bacterium]|nr:hypothetical protein [Bryobacteraceae bacterium]
MGLVEAIRHLLPTLVPTTWSFTGSSGVDLTRGIAAAGSVSRAVSGSFAAGVGTFYAQEMLPAQSGAAAISLRYYAAGGAISIAPTCFQELPRHGGSGSATWTPSTGVGPVLRNPRCVDRLTRSDFCGAALIISGGASVFAGVGGTLVIFGGSEFSVRLSEAFNLVASSPYGPLGPVIASAEDFSPSMLSLYKGAGVIAGLNGGVQAGASITLYRAHIR